MSTRIKTIAYTFPMNFADVDDDAEYEFPSITVTIPEAASGITFRSAMLEVGFHDKITATGGTIEDTHTSMQIDASGYTTIDDNYAFTHSARNIGGVLGPFDFTGLFNANWGTALTHTVYAKFRIDQNTGTTLGMRALSAILWLTYEYDDVAQYHAKTAIIPLDSLSNSLSTAPDSEIGTNQIPRLTGVGGFLPESSITILDYFFIIEGNVSANAVGSFDLSWRIDADTTYVMTAICALASSSYFLRYVSRYTGSEPALDSVHAFRMWSSIANRMHAVTITLYVTYKFDASASETILNTQILPFGEIRQFVTGVADDSMLINAWVEEPETVTLKQSAVRWNYAWSGAPGNFNLWVGAQESTPRSYTILGTVYTPTSQYSVQQRFDSGAAAGAGITLSRGQLEVWIGAHYVSGSSLMSLGGYMILNYHSAKAQQGVGAHAHAVREWLRNHTFAGEGTMQLASQYLHIPESNHYLISLGLVGKNWHRGIYTWVLICGVKLLDGESDEVHTAQAATIWAGYNPSRTFYQEIIAQVDGVRKWANDPQEDSFKATDAHTFLLIGAVPWYGGLFFHYTYHSIAFTVNGKLIGYSGNGSGITVDLFRSDNDEYLGSAMTTAGGNYSFQWYDNTISLYAIARQDSLRVGRSDDGMAS